MAAAHIKLSYKTKAGDTLCRLVHRDQILEVDQDPRPGVDSKSIVKLRDGTKLFVVNSYHDITSLLLGGAGGGGAGS